MVEDEVIAEQLETLLTPTITNQENYYRKHRDLGIIKQKRKPNVKLIVAPFRDLQRGTDQFFSIFLQRPLDKGVSALTCHKWKSRTTITAQKSRVFSSPTSTNSTNSTKSWTVSSDA
jgi:hypothetical protein